MRLRRIRRGATNTLYILIVGSIVAVGVLLFLLFGGIGSDQDETDQLVLYCAAGMRQPMEEIIKDYEEEFGVTVEVTYSGSNTLLSQLTADKSGDLYLAGDDIYIEMARDRKLAREAIPLAQWRPVIVVKRDGETSISSIADLLNPELRIAVGNPDQAAIGRKTRKLAARVAALGAVERDRHRQRRIWCDGQRDRHCCGKRQRRRRHRVGRDGRSKPGTARHTDS